MLARGAQEAQQQEEEQEVDEAKKPLAVLQKASIHLPSQPGMMLSECGSGHLTIELQQGDWCEKSVAKLDKKGRATEDRGGASNPVACKLGWNLR